MLRRAHLLLLTVFRRLPRSARRFVVRRVAPSFTVGAMCVIERDDGAILFVRHSYRQHWGLPGGLLARGETPDVAARREATEEVGLAVDLVGDPLVVVDADARRVDIIYRARLSNGSDDDAITLSSAEVVDARWFAADAVPQLQFETRGALEAVQSRH